jgi:hypothetical protein
MKPGPFDAIVRNIAQAGYHNHREPSHSNLLSDQIVRDLERACPSFRDDRAKGRFREWRNVKGPDGRNTDLLIGAPTPKGKPDLSQVRILLENKSVVTAHRNRNARFQDVERETHAIHAENPRTIVVATLIVGVCERVLNVPDCVKKPYKSKPERFDAEILPRLSSGDATLWDEFEHCVSVNRADDPMKTVEYFRALPVREPADSHERGLDFMLFIPMAIDNVAPPRLAKLPGIEPVAQYKRMIERLCYTYKIRWAGK